VDFGLATTRVESSTSTTSTIRNTNNVWRAPELLLKPGAKFTKESDVWSYGCVLYEIATGSVPWAGVSLDEVKSFYREKTCLEIPEEVDSQFAKLIRLCWQFEPKERPSFRDIVKVIGNSGSADIGF
jgi:serine/threonine protein kinase